VSANGSGGVPAVPSEDGRDALLEHHAAMQLRIGTLMGGQRHVHGRGPARDIHVGVDIHKARADSEPRTVNLLHPRHRNADSSHFPSPDTYVGEDGRGAGAIDEGASAEYDVTLDGFLCVSVAPANGSDTCGACRGYPEEPAPVHGSLHVVAPVQSVYAHPFRQVGARACLKPQPLEVPCGDTRGPARLRDPQMG